MELKKTSPSPSNSSLLFDSNSDHTSTRSKSHASETHLDFNFNFMVVVAAIAIVENHLLVLVVRVGVSRGVHGSGRSGFCPTRKPTRKRSGSRFSTHNRPVKRVGFCGSVCQRVASVSGEAETRQKTQKNNQNCRDLARSGQDSVRISSNPIIFPPNRVENRWIWCIYVESYCFGHRNLPNQAENSSESLENLPKLMSWGGLGFTGFE